MAKAFLLVGEGIECEKESIRFLQLAEPGIELHKSAIPYAASAGQDLLEGAEEGDWLFIPGGFSFADHYGAGLLLAERLKELGLFERAIDKKLRLFGVCNGFQMLVASGLFGESLRLLENREQGRRAGFINRWVKLKTAEFLSEEDSFLLPVRHGEGRLFTKDSVFEAGVRPFLHYSDEKFENGSQDRVAGLFREINGAQVWGMMPHPEVALYPLQNPDVVGSEFFERFRSRTREMNGDGVRLWKMISTFEGGQTSS